jgi:hypothetical protein
MVYQLSKIGRRVTWEQWKRTKGCGLSDQSRCMASMKLNMPEARWLDSGTTLGEIEDAWAIAGREMARFATEHLNRPEWATPYKGGEDVQNA